MNIERGTGADRPTALRVSNLVKFFQRRDKSVVPAIDDVSLTVRAGEFVVLLGPSGCGKTTLLRCIAGLETPDTGEIEVGGRPAFSSTSNLNVPPNGRALNMMFQSYALWPHMTVAQNVGFPLKTRGVAKPEIKARVEEVLGLVSVGELSGQYPAQLSGGQQQRVALARALVAGDQLILFDEPLSNVDAKVREQLRYELVEMQSRLGFAAVYVTHDQHEAMELADRVVVLQSGRIAQNASPADVYQRPASSYVANFIGTTNEIKGRVESAANGRIRISTELGEIECDRDVTGLESGSAITIQWRPENSSLLAANASVADTDLVWEGVVTATMFAGSHTTVVLEIGRTLVRVQTHNRIAPKEGDGVRLSVDRDSLLLIDESGAVIDRPTVTQPAETELVVQ